MLRSTVRVAAGLMVAVILAGCSRSQAPSAPAPTPGPAAPVTVTDISVGRSVNPDKTIADKTDSFGPNDLFYVSVTTEGSSSSASLQAKWTFGDGQPVSDSTQTIAPTGHAVTELHAEKPDGWPAGTYKVEVFLNGVSAGSHSFEVK